MAVTAIWRVKGWLGKVVVYVENPDKTTNPAYYVKENMSEKECQGLGDVIAYAVNSITEYCFLCGRDQIPPYRTRLP